MICCYCSSIFIFFSSSFLCFSYKKFIRSKDTSQYSEKDLACIFGKTAGQSAPATPQNQSDVSCSSFSFPFLSLSFSFSFLFFLFPFFPFLPFLSPSNSYMFFVLSQLPKCIQTSMEHQPFPKHKHLMYN